MRIPGRRRDKTVYSVTDAARPYSEDIDARRRRYLFWMGVRTLCFILAIVLVLALHGQARVIAFFVVAIPAMVLPMLSVVFANAGREPSGGKFETYDPQHLELAENDPAAEADRETEPYVDGQQRRNGAGKPAEHRR